MQKKNYKEPINFGIILAAITGDVDAINQVVFYFQPYINSKCKRKVWDEYGNVHYMVDEYMKRRMETRLITKILDFKIIL